MIIWINGPYGVGKSALARELQTRLAGSFLFDAEQVGNAVRDNVPQMYFKETFEEFPLWHEMCYRLLRELDTLGVSPVLVPMTLLMPESEEKILGRLRENGVDVRHVLLQSDHDTVKSRILARGEAEDCWCMRQIDRCMLAQQSFPCDITLRSVDKTVPQLADIVLSAISI